MEETSHIPKSFYLEVTSTALPLVQASHAVKLNKGMKMYTQPTGRQNKDADEKYSPKEGTDYGK